MKKCIKCGSSIDDGMEFCPFCNAKQPMPDTIKKQPIRAAKPIKAAEKVKKVEEAPDIEQQIIKRQKENAEKKEQSKKKRDELEKMEFLAFHDELTKLFNRQAFERDIKEVSQKEICIGSVDANNLKKTNDTMGHKYGDVLLNSIAECLIETFGEKAVYRVGGDEFAILLTGIGHKVIEEKIVQFKKLLEAKESMQETKFSMTASVGFAFGDGIKTKKELIDLADSDMYKDKKEYKNGKSDDEIEPIPGNPLNVPSADKKMFTTDGKYNPNYDGYYDDISYEDEVIDEKLSKESLIKAAEIIIAGIIFVVVFLFIL